MIGVSNVTVRHGNGVEALSKVNLHIERGQFAFLVGTTGSGKSTLLRLLYRDLLPTEGKVTVDGLDVTALRGREIPNLRRRLGVVFQDFRLLPYKTAAENVAFALQVIGAEPRSVHRQVMTALGKVGLAHRDGARPHELSGGEQQRICIARALVNDPPLLLADEPTGNLDPDSSFELVGLLEQINQSGTTVVVATHDRDIVDHFRQRVIRLADGRVVSDEAESGYHGPDSVADEAPLLAAPVEGDDAGV